MLSPLLLDSSPPLSLPYVVKETRKTYNAARCFVTGPSHADDVHVCISTISDGIYKSHTTSRHSTHET